MYLPETFRLDDRGELFAHAAANPFATLVTHLDDGRDGHNGLEVSHLPLLVDAERGLLRGHLARENPQLAHLEAGAAALAVFHGPHAYVSPSVYTQHPSVPTWNYVVVHARGRARLLADGALRALLDEMVARFDPTGWRFDAPADYTARMCAAIAGFEIAVESLEGKWKLSQNRPLEDQERVAAWLERGDSASAASANGREVAALMRARLSTPRSC
jgi:transcriptional regulator